MSHYSPFDTPLDEIDVEDLKVLNDTKEGWYVEYKSQDVNADKLAKSLSAFANTYGGWLFLGVGEKSRDNAVAGSFPGIPSSAADAVLQRLRQSAAGHVAPAPFFNTRVFSGPCDALGLPAGRSVIAVEVPRSLTTPHVHKNGRIYRRVADGSEPTPETDRFALDQLWGRGVEVRKRVRQWVARDPEFSDAEKQKPYVRILLCTDPWHLDNPPFRTTRTEIQRVLLEDQGNGYNIPIDTMYTTSQGVLARQVGTNEPTAYTASIAMSRRLVGDVVVPVTLYDCHSLTELRSQLDGYCYAQKFISILNDRGYSSVRVVDLNLLMHVLVATAAMYRSLLRAVGQKTEYYFKLRILNAWRVCPFIDVERSLDQFAEHGIPLLMESTVTVPAGRGPETFLGLREPEARTEKRPEVEASAVQAALMFSGLAVALGIESFMGRPPGRAGVGALYLDLINAGQRAMSVQADRHSAVKWDNDTEL